MIYLAGEVCPQMYLDVAKRLDKRPNRINICMNSEGGDLLSGLAIYDRLMQVKDCTITATGENASSATIILMAAKLRRATPTTQFYFHLTEIHRKGKKEEESEMSASDLRVKIHFDQVLFSVFATRMSYDNIRAALSEKVFGVEKALKWGIIDEIWSGK